MARAACTHGTVARVYVSSPCQGKLSELAWLGLGSLAKEVSTEGLVFHKHYKTVSVLPSCKDTRLREVCGGLCLALPRVTRESRGPTFSPYLSWLCQGTFSSDLNGFGERNLDSQAMLFSALDLVISSPAPEIIEDAQEYLAVLSKQALPLPSWRLRLLHRI